VVELKISWEEYGTKSGLKKVDEEGEKGTMDNQARGGTRKGSWGAFWGSRKSTIKKNPNLKTQSKWCQGEELQET